MRIIVILTAIVIVVDYLSAQMQLRKAYLRSPIQRAIGAFLVIWAIVYVGRFDGSAFIYFQF